MSRLSLVIEELQFQLVQNQARAKDKKTQFDSKLNEIQDMLEDLTQCERKIQSLKANVKSQNLELQRIKDSLEEGPRISTPQLA